MLAGTVSPLTVTASPRFAAAELPRVVASSREVVEAFIDAASPVVFMPDRAKADVGRLLTPDDLRHAFQNKGVTVSVSHRGSFRSPTGSDILGKRMSFADFADYAENLDQQSDERLYLSQFALDGTSITLPSDVATPLYVP